MQLFQFELIKLSKSKVFLMLSLLLIAANLVTIHTMERHGVVYFYIYEQRENYRRFLEGDERADVDGYYRSEQEAQRSYLETYPIFVEEMADRANRMKQTALYMDTESFVYRNLVKTQRDFASFSGSVLIPDNCFGIRAYAGYNGGLLFILVFLAMLTYYVLFFERSLYLTPLLKGCKRGHTPLAVAKLSAMLWAAILYVLLQETAALLLFGWMYGYGDLGRSIQSVSVFRNCAFHLTVGGALAAIGAVRAAVTAVFVCILFAIGTFLKSETAAAIVSCAVFGGEYFLSRAFEISGSLSGLKCVNPFYCWDMQKMLGEYHNLNLFGYPVGKSACALAAALLVAAILPIAGLIAFNRTCQIKVESRVERLMQWLRAGTSCLSRRTSLLHYEFYKMLIQQKKGIVLVLLLLWGVYESVGVFAPTYYASAEEAAYHHYISLVSGPVTEETFAFFEEEAARLDGMRGEIRELIRSGSADDALMSQALQSELDMLEDGFEMAKAQFDALQKMPGDIWNKYMLDEQAYQKIWLNTGTDIRLWFVGTAAMLYFASGIYPIDEKKKMLPLLRTTRNGYRKLYRSKNYCGLLYIGLIYLVTELPLFLQYKKIDNFAAAAQRLCDFTSGVFSSACPLRLMIAAVFTLKALSFLAVGLMGLWLSRRTKNETLTWLIGIGAVGMVSMILWRLGWDIHMLFLSIL